MATTRCRISGCTPHTQVLLGQDIHGHIAAPAPVARQHSGKGSCQAQGNDGVHRKGSNGLQDGLGPLAGQDGAPKAHRSCGDHAGRAHLSYALIQCPQLIRQVLPPQHHRKGRACQHRIGKVHVPAVDQEDDEGHGQDGNPAGKARVFFKGPDPFLDVPLHRKVFSPLPGLIEHMAEVQEHKGRGHQGRHRTHKRSRQRRRSHILGRDDVVQLGPAGNHGKRCCTGSRHDTGRNQLAGQIRLLERGQEDGIHRKDDDKDADAPVTEDGRNQKGPEGRIPAAEPAPDHPGERRDQKGLLHHLAEQGIGHKHQEILGNESGQ